MQGRLVVDGLNHFRPPVAIHEELQSDSVGVDDGHAAPCRMVTDTLCVDVLARQSRNRPIEIVLVPHFEAGVMEARL